MPKKKTTFSVSATATNGVIKGSQLRILALFFWDAQLQSYCLYGLSECSSSYQKMVKNICYSFVEHEEIELRLQACNECLCADTYFEDGRFVRCDLRLDRVPDTLITKLRSNVDSAILKDRQVALIEREQQQSDE